jgi:hypothetical protein
MIAVGELDAAITIQRRAAIFGACLPEDPQSNPSASRRGAARGKIASADASRQARILAVMKTCIESSDSEKRLEALEAKLSSPAQSGVIKFKKIV